MIGRISAALLGATLMMTSPSMAQQASSGLYGGAALGQSIFWDTDLNGGGELEYDFFALFISGALGYQLTSNLRAEAELLYETADVDNSFVDVEIFRSTVSGYYDFSPIQIASYAASPYAGLGVGFAFVELFDDDIGLTWHAETGASIPITDRIAFVPGVRFEYNSIDENGVEDDSIWVTQLRAGVRYAF